MNQDIRSEEAAAALGVVQSRQQDVIEAVLVPRWYWWLVAGLMVGLGLVVDTQHSPTIGIATVVFALLVGGVSAWIVLGARQGAQIHSQMLGQKGPVAIVAFVWAAVGLSLGVAFSLRAVHFPYPATAGTLAGGIAMVVGGPALMSLLRKLLLANRTGAR